MGPWTYLIPDDHSLGLQNGFIPFRRVGFFPLQPAALASTPVGSIQGCAGPSRSDCPGPQVRAVPKSDEALLILDRKALNALVQIHKFKMESIHSVVAFFHQWHFLASVDIDAHLHIPICEGHQHFLRFAIGDAHYQLVALPFRLASASWVFTKVKLKKLRSAVRQLLSCKWPFLCYLHASFRPGGGYLRSGFVYLVPYENAAEGNAAEAKWNRSPAFLENRIHLEWSTRASLLWLQSPSLQTGKSFLPVHWTVVTTDGCLSGWKGVLGPDSVGSLDSRGSSTALRCPGASSDQVVTDALDGSPEESDLEPVRQPHCSGLCQLSERQEKCSNSAARFRGFWQVCWILWRMRWWCHGIGTISCTPFTPLRLISLLLHRIETLYQSFW